MAVDHPSRTVLFAGGGSGGHISPALAIAERLVGTADTLFVCSTRPVDGHMLTTAGVEHVAIPALPMTLRPRGVPRFVRSFRRCRRICRGLIRERGVDQVVALGGFVAAPVAVAARAERVPVTLLNLDCPPGRANRWIARICNRVWSAIELPDLPDFAERVVGIPIRQDAIAPASQADCRRQLGLAPDRPTLLVTGASQGARSLNELVPALAAGDDSLLADWQVIHLCGRDAETAVRAAYEHHGVQAMVRPFLDQIGLAWGAASLAISRAGANSVAEAFANAVPTVFLPYPHHRDMHQRHNARPMVEVGGAMLIEDRSSVEANVGPARETLHAIMTDRAEREAMRTRLLARRPPDAAGVIAALLTG